MASVTVASGQTVSGVSVINEHLQVNSGGTVSGAIVGSGGTLHVDPGGAIIATDIAGFGHLQVSTGARASGTIVGDQGLVEVNGQDNGAVVEPRGVLNVLAGGVRDRHHDRHRGGRLRVRQSHQRRGGQPRGHLQHR